jgi:Domain of unknown function (DUF4388)
LALQGTLDTFSLPDVLRLLATTTKSGRLRIEGDRGQGSVWLHEGSIVDATADRAVDGTPADEVVFELLRFESGSFAFDSDDRAVDSARPEEVEELLRRATSLLGEWGELEAVVPSLEHQVTLTTDLSSDQVTIDADHWRSVVAVASGRTVGELATTLGLTELGVSRAVRDLVELGVADIDAPGTVPEPPAHSSADGARRAPSPRPAAERPQLIPDPAEGQRAGWLAADRTGEIPAIPDPRGAPAPAGNGQPRASRDDVPPARPTGDRTRGVTSRQGRGRHAAPGTPPTNGSARGVDGATPAPSRTNDTGRTRPVAGDPTGPGRTGRPEDTGRTRPVAGDPTGPGRTERRPAAGGDPTGPGRTGRPGDTGHSPAVGGDPPGPGRTGRPGDTGRSPAVGGDATGPGRTGRPGDTGRSPAAGGDATGPGRAPGRPGDTGRSPLAGPGGPGGTGPAGRRDPGAPPRRPSLPGRDLPAEPSSPFDAGRLGPSPLPGDTGQIRPVNPSSLPPDLSWAADDINNTGPVSSPFSGLTSLGPGGHGPTGPGPSGHGPSRPPRGDGEIAPHVAAMSPEARAAVQSTVGNAGGSAPGPGNGHGEDVTQRTRLISFLSTVR